MWKRDHQLLDVYGRKGFPSLQQNQRSKDDSVIVQTKSLYTLPSMSHSQPCLEVYTRKISSTSVYQGNEFDVFNNSSDNNEEESIIPTQQQPEKQQAQPQLQLQESESTSSHSSIKRTSINYLIDKDVTKKRRTTTTTTTATTTEETSDNNNLLNDKSVINGGVFIKSTAPANTPANIFMIHPEAEQSSYDLEYY